MIFVRLFLLLQFLGLSACSEVRPDVFIKNNEAAKKTSESRFSEAKSLLLDAMSADPFEPALHYNLGYILSAQEDPESALKSYQEAQSLEGDSEVRFRAAFNSGVLYQKAKNKELALKAYQEALIHKPESRETRVNIELLLQDQQGGGEGSDQNQDPNQKGQGNQNQQKDPNQDGEQKEPGENQNYGDGQKPQPQQFQSKELSPSDVNKILREIKQQEGRIRMEFNRTGPKEEPRGKDW
jgi:tetratricopeptide (TPR) repeat protein